MKKEDKIAPVIVGFVLFILAALISVGLVTELPVFGGGSFNGNSLFAFTHMLFLAYGFSSIFIPVFLIAAGILCFIDRWSVQKSCSLLVSIIPFFTFVFAEKLCKKATAYDDGPVASVKVLSIILIAVFVVIAEYLLTSLLAGKIAGTKKSDGTYSDDSLSLGTDESSEEDGESYEGEIEVTPEEEADIKKRWSFSSLVEKAKEKKEAEEDDEISKAVDESIDKAINTDWINDDISKHTSRFANVDRSESQTVSDTDETSGAGDISGGENISVEDETSGTGDISGEEEISGAGDISVEENISGKEEISGTENTFAAEENWAAEKSVEENSSVKETVSEQMNSEESSEDEVDVNADPWNVTSNGGTVKCLGKVVKPSRKNAEVPDEINYTIDTENTLAESDSEEEKEFEKTETEFASAEIIQEEDPAGLVEPIQFDDEANEMFNFTEDSSAQKNLTEENNSVSEDNTDGEDEFGSFDIYPDFETEENVNETESENSFDVFESIEQEDSIGASKIHSSVEASFLQGMDEEKKTESEIIEGSSAAETSVAQKISAPAAETSVAQKISAPAAETPVAKETSVSATTTPVAQKTSVPEKPHSMFSSLDSVFAKMDMDAMADVEANESEESLKEKAPVFDQSAGPVVDSHGKLISKQIENNLLADSADSKLSASQTSSSGASASVTQQKSSVVKPAQSSAAPVTKPAPKKVKRGPYKIPTDLLTEYSENPYWIIDDETTQAAQNLKDTMNEFKIEAEITGIKKGPVVTMFEMLPAPGVKLSKIVALQDNIALRLAASSVRIVAPIPGKRAVGIEVPNAKRAIVSFRECIEQNRPEWKKMAVPVILGKDIQGETQIMDLVKTPHLLIAGSTGAGKSVCVNSMILSILYKRSPNEVKMILIDPKIVELKLYNDIPHLLTPVITESKKAMQALQYCLCEMERRYALLDGLGVRDISNYNKRIDERKICTEKLPYLVVIIDEFADLMATTGKELESVVARLAAMSRAVGIHLVLATQRPSIDVITGLIKANIPSRIAFMVASKTDSRIIIDQVGADKLLGKGDMLYASATDPYPVRIQGTFISDNEVESVVESVKEWGEPDYIDDEIFIDDEDDEGGNTMSLFNAGGEDPLYEKALDVVIQAGKASASYIQRRLKIGYNRAARLVEEMEERGIVGPANGSKPREIIHMP